MGEHVLCDAAKQQFSQPLSTVRRHENDVALQFIGFLDNPKMWCRGGGRFSDTRYSRQCGCGFNPGEFLPGRTFEPALDTSGINRRAHRNGQARLFLANVWRQAGPGATGKFNGRRYSLARLVGTVNGQQDVFEHRGLGLRANRFAYARPIVELAAFLCLQARDTGTTCGERFSIRKLNRFSYSIPVPPWTS